MKIVITSVILCLFFSSCKHEDFVPDCNCANLASFTGLPTGYYGDQEGMIIFPKYPNFPYFIWAKTDFTRYANGKPYHIVCTDSALVKQIKEKGIKDSSDVLMRGVSAFITGGCNIFYQRTFIPSMGATEFAAPELRMESIDKK
jgi:hypothetical protein